MKSLNNTIKGLEHCININNTCDKCIYNKKYTRQCRKDNDALYHLKQYRSLLIMWNNKLDKEQQNKSLTWEELKTMEGKPIWVECEGYTPYWEVIEYIGITRWGRGEIIETHLSILYKEDQGKTWQAYRKERNEDAR